MNQSESQELIQGSQKTVSQDLVSDIDFQQDKCLEILQYKEITQFKQIQIQSYHLFTIANTSYIMLIHYDEQYQRLSSIYDLDQQNQMQCDKIIAEKFDGVTTNKNSLYIIGRQRITQLCLINRIFKLKKIYICKKKVYQKKIKFLNDQQNLIFEGTNNMIRLRSLNLQKQIFKLQSVYTNIQYHSQNYVLVQLVENYDDNPFINIVNIQNRQIVVRQHYDPYSKIIQIILIQNTNDLLIQYQNKGLFLYKINYLTRSIERIKIIGYSELQICIFDDNNNLNIMTPKFYIRYDNQYNMIQRFKISYGFKEDCFQELLEGFSNVRIKQKLPQILCLKQRQRQKYVFYLQANNQVQKTPENYICFSECNNVQFEYLKQDKTQHIISQNSKYFTFIFGKSLVFHYTQNKQDLQVYFNQYIRFINLSQTSDYLYVVLGDRFNTYKTKQNLKRCNQRFDNINQLLTQQPGLLIGLNYQGSACAYSKTSGKLIFKQKIMHWLQSFDYQNGIILISQYDRIFLYSLENRKQLLTLLHHHLQTKLIPNSQQLLILKQSGELELWSYKNQHPQHERIIMNEVKIMIQGYQNIICLRKLDSIIILDQNCQQMKSIKYRELKLVKDTDVINQNDQILSEEQIIQLDFYEINDQASFDPKQIVISIESI